MVIAVAIVLWVLILIAVAHFFGCSLTIESGIEAHYKNQGDEEPAVPTPTPWFSPTSRGEAPLARRGA